MFSSIRIKLTLWYVCVLALIIIAFSVVTYSIFVNVLREETDENLIEMATSLATAVEAEQNDGEKYLTPDNILKDALSEFRFRDYQYGVFAPDNSLIATTLEKGLPPDIHTAIQQNKFGNLLLEGEPLRVFEFPLQIERNRYKLYVLHSLQDRITLENRIQRVFFLIAPLVLLFVGTGGYFLARQSLKPVAEMGDKAKRISASNLHERLPIANERDELGNLALVFNDLLDRLDVEFDRQQRFMADASHELRTPLAIVCGESEVALSDASRTPVEYQESLLIVNEEGLRLTKIVEDLFALARADSGELRANLRTLYLDEVVADCVRAVRTLADKRNIAIELIGEETLIKGDETLLRRLLLNLLDNAVKYNHDDGKIKVTVRNNSVMIANTGSEIPEEKRELIFERFYRLEKARSTNVKSLTSGAGLGLSIAKRIAELHIAHLTFARSNDNENVFSLTFPL